MKLNLIALALGTAFVATSANAALENTWSFGGAAGYAHASDHKFDAGESLKGNGYGIKLDAEYNFTNWFALGMGYDYLNGQKVKNFDMDNRAALSASKAKFHTNVVELYGRFAYPLDNTGSDIFFKIGPTYNKMSVEHNSNTALGAVAGIGAQWALTDAFALRAGYDYFYNTVKEGGDRIDNSLLYLGFQYTFGCDKKAPVVAAAPAAKQTVRVTNKHTLDADILFPFDGSTLSAKGKDAVSTIVESSANLENTEYSVYGYTDRIGSDAYNDKLSQKRADAVSAELQTKGIAPAVSEGKGKSAPVTGNKCDTVKGRTAVVECLAPDRRVEVVVTGDTVETK